MAAINRKIGNALDINNYVNKEFLQLMNYFANDTVEKILEHIDRMGVKDTGALKSSIRGVVAANAGGNSAVVSFFMLYYAPYVERALGRYWGVDADLRKGEGVAGANVDVAPIGGVGYGAVGARFHDLPYAGGYDHGMHDTLRQKTHRPRPFVMAEIRRQVERISYRLLAELGNTMEIHILDAIDEAFSPMGGEGNVWGKAGYKVRYDTGGPEELLEVY